MLKIFLARILDNLCCMGTNSYTLQPQEYRKNNFLTYKNKIFQLTKQIFISFTVSGNANFKMQRTCLTLCGMTQPTTAAPLIVDKNNVDKGLASRFLWIFPKPVFKKFASLEVSANEELKEASKNFTIHLGNWQLHQLIINNIISSQLHLSELHKLWTYHKINER